jgi:integrase
MAADSRPLRERSSDGHRRRVDAAGGRYLGLAPDLTSAKGEPPVELDWRAFCARYFPAGGQRFGQNLHLRCSVGRGSPDATNRNRHARFGLTLGDKQVGYAKLTRRRHDRKPSGKLAHLWWYRCLERAELVPKGTTGGMNMHRGRHTAATELQRAHHDLRLTQLLLGHTDIRSTARYAQLDTTDLAKALLELQEGDT